MSWMITNAGQILDEQRHARQRPEISFITVSQRPRHQGLSHLLCLLHRQFGFRPRRALACQSRAAAFIPSLFPTVGYLTGDAQSAGGLRSGTIFGKEFASFLAAFFHFGMIARFAHAQSIAQARQMSLYYASLNKRA